MPLHTICNEVKANGVRKATPDPGASRGCTTSSRSPSGHIVDGGAPQRCSQEFYDGGLRFEVLADVHWQRAAV